MNKEIEVLEKLVGFNTIQDKENKEFIDYVEKFLLDLGFKVENKEKYLIMSIGENCKLSFLGHSDTVELTDGWETEPLKLTLKNGHLYGLGASDMKGGIAAFLTALTEVNLNELKNGIKVYITYDEEIGFCGIRDVCKVEKNFPEYNIIGEPTDNVMMTGCKGLFAIKMRTTGVKVHSSTPEKGKSAINEMIKVMNELTEFYEKNIKDEKNEIYEIPYTTMNIGLFNGGSAINSVAADCYAYVDFRVAIENHIDLLKNKLNELCDKYDFSYEIDEDIKPFYENVEFISEVKTAGFMTEASFMTGKRIILGVGPVTAHEVNEHISVESLRKTVDQYKMIIEKVCMN